MIWAGGEDCEWAAALKALEGGQLDESVERRVSAVWLEAGGRGGREGGVEGEGRRTGASGWMVTTAVGAARASGTSLTMEGGWSSRYLVIAVPLVDVPPALLSPIEQI